MFEHHEEQKKTARLEARLTPAAYELVQRAASLEGRSVSEFVVAAAQEAALASIERQTLIELSKEDQERFAAALLNPPPPNKALEDAFRANRELIEPS